MLPPFECCLLNSILHDDFNMGYYFCPHRVAHFILQSIMLGILMPGTNAEGAVTVVEKLYLFLTVVAVELEDGKKNIKVKPSIGAASFQESDIDVIEVYERARTELTYDRG